MGLRRSEFHRSLFVLGEGRLLFSYAVNQYDHPYNEIGPVYVPEPEYRRYVDHESFPPEVLR